MCIAIYMHNREMLFVKSSSKKESLERNLNQIEVRVVATYLAIAVV